MNAYPILVVPKNHHHRLVLEVLAFEVKPLKAESVSPGRKEQEGVVQFDVPGQELPQSLDLIISNDFRALTEPRPEKGLAFLF